MNEPWHTRMPKTVYLIEDGGIVWAVVATRELAEAFCLREFEKLSNIWPAQVYERLEEMPTTDENDHLDAVNQGGG